VVGAVDFGEGVGVALFSVGVWVAGVIFILAFM
jgi:hypothetical protein